MTKASAHSTYARIVGEVAIAWNGLERRLHSLIYHYLRVDPHVAGFILGEMRNPTKEEFAKFLIERFENHDLLKEHACTSWRWSTAYGKTETFSSMHNPSALASDTMAQFTR